METAGVSGVMLPLWLAHQVRWMVDERAASNRCATQLSWACFKEGVDIAIAVVNLWAYGHRHTTKA
jgi:hypothetical protein